MRVGSSVAYRQNKSVCLISAVFYNFFSNIGASIAFAFECCFLDVTIFSVKCYLKSNLLPLNIGNLKMGRQFC